MDGIANSVIASVATTVVLAALGWLWLHFTEAGQSLWKNLGTFEWAEPHPATALVGSGKQIFHIHGIRTVAIVAAIALILALGALTAFFLRPAAAGAAPTVPQFVVQRFGAKGRAGRIPGGGDEGDYVATNNDTLTKLKNSPGFAGVAVTV